MLFRILMTCVAFVSAPFLGTQALAADRAALERQAQAYLQPLLRTNNFSGVVLVAKGDEIILQKGFGFASIEHRVPNSAASVFQIASVSKPFTSAAILLLAEQGKIDIHAPLMAVLPTYPNAAKLKIHHLLSHTSGIPNINDFPEYEGIQRRPHTPDELVAHFRNKPLEFEPGSRYSYSNSNYNLLALIIEKASGQDYGSFIRSAILEPLNLKHTGHHGSAAQIIPRIANGYAPAGNVGLERAPFLDWSVKTGNGSIYSDAEGVMRFIRAVNKGKLLKPASISAAFTEHTPNVGYGWFLASANGRRIHHINGRSPGWAAQADYYVQDDVTVVVLANTYISVSTEVARAVGAMFFGLPVKQMPGLRPDRLNASEIAALIGTYQFGPDYYVPNALVTVKEQDGFLEAMVGEHGPYPLVQITPNRFLMRSFWVPTEFHVDGQGTATEMTIDGLKGRRAS